MGRANWVWTEEGSRGVPVLLDGQEVSGLCPEQGSPGGPHWSGKAPPSVALALASAMRAEAGAQDAGSVLSTVPRRHAFPPELSLPP